MKISNIKNLRHKDWRISLWLKISKFKLPEKKFAKVGQRVVGLDISGRYCMAVELTHTKGALPILSAFGRKDLKGPDLQDAIGALAGDMHLGTKMVNIALPSSSCVVRYIDLPKMTKEEVASSIRFEAEKYIPYPVGDAVLDFQILREQSDGKRITILLVCAKRELVDKYIKLLRDASLGAAVIDITSMALVNSFLFSGEDAAGGRTIALFDVGQEASEVTILKDSLPCFTRAISFGATNKTDLLSELRLSFDYYESQFEKGIEGIFLSGEAAGWDSLDGFLKENLRLNVSFWDVHSKLSLGPQVARDEIEPYAHSLGVAVGLALRI